MLYVEQMFFDIYTKFVWLSLVLCESTEPMDSDVNKYKFHKSLN